MRPPVGQSQHGVTPFQVRLVVLGGLVLLVFAVLGWRLIRLATDDHWLVDAERVLFRSETLATSRGAILDQADRPLAIEVPSWTFEVHYEAINGDWAMRQARRDARRAVGPAWNSMSGSDRYAATEAAAGRWDEAIAEVWSTLASSGRMTADEILVFRGDIVSDVGRLRDFVWKKQIERLEARYPEDALERFKAQPIAEETGPMAFHEVVDRLDGESALPLVRAVDRLERLVREAGGDPTTDPAFRLRPASHRDRGYSSATVVLDRSTLPEDLRQPRPLRVRVDGVGSTVVGAVREQVTVEDVRRRPFERIDEATGMIVRDLTGYSSRRPHELVGSTGIEREFDRLLHGSIGFREENRSTGELVVDDPPVRGDDVRLAIDMNLQARLRAVLDPAFGLMRSRPGQYGWSTATGEPNPMTVPEGTPLHGAAVVLDVRTGEVLSVVSTPVAAELDLDDRDYRLMNVSDEEAASLPAADRRRRDELARLAPFRNRAIATEYPPGSIVKPLMYVGGVEMGRLRPDEVIECRGHSPRSDDPESRPRCWGWRPERDEFHTHGPIGPVEAISSSCNIYFYELAARLGPERVREWYRACGLESPLSAGLGAARDGTFDRGRIAGRSDRMIIGIGQGPVAWTPLHAATAYARLARAGAPIDPVMVHGPERPATLPPGDWNPVAVRTALEGMRASAREGTAARVRTGPGRRESLLDFPDLGAAAPTVWAKTGTAQVAGKAPHAWYAGLVAPAGTVEPRYAFAIVVEHGNSGGQAAGPVAGQLIRALAAEGYLGPAALREVDATPVTWRDPIEGRRSDDLRAGGPAS